MWSLVLFVGLLCSVSGAWAQDFPTRPITMMIGMPAGGAIDVSVRSMAPELAKILGQELVPVNKTGGGGTVAVGALAASKGDGYTLLAINSAALTNAPHLESLPFDPLKDVVPIIQFGSLVPIYVVRADSPFNNLKDVIDFSRKNPGKVSLGHTGVGVVPHVIMELVNLEEKAGITTVPFDGGPPAMAALLGGHVTICGTSINSAMPFIKSGKVKALGVTSEKRMDLAPTIPTLAEQGFPHCVMVEFYGIMAPKGTPKPIADKVENAFRKAMQTPAFKEYGRNTYLYVENPLGGAKLGEYMQKEYVKAGEIIKKAKLTK